MYVKFQHAPGPDEESEPEQSGKGIFEEGQHCVTGVSEPGQGEEVIQYWNDKGREWPGIVC